MTAALIVGLSGTKLTPNERAFYRDVRPAGVILFRRNVLTQDLIKPLIDDVREAVGRDDLLVLIDQEGGRVQRLKPPLARDLPPAAIYANLYATDQHLAKTSAFAVARLVAHELRSYGINTNCAPVLDVPVAGAHDIIGDRAYGTTPEQIMARRAGRPSGSVKPNPKASTTIRFDADVLAALRASGAGWQTRVSDAVRELVKAGRL